jgi:hypothetical protein
MLSSNLPSSSLAIPLVNDGDDDDVGTNNRVEDIYNAATLVATTSSIR